LGQQRVDGVLSAKVIHSRKETYRAKEPPYRVVGTARGDDDSYRRAGHGYNYPLNPEVEDVRARGREVPS
jgi:hypothetical protein